MKPDVIISWPRNCDYPLWRKFIRLNRTLFNEIIIAFTETNQGDDYREFVKKAMFVDYVRFLQAPSPRAEEDWRHLAVKACLLHSYNAEWIWFTEQDFIITGKNNFWPEIAKAEAEGNEVIAIKQGNRVHPACIFIKRETLYKTKMYFAVTPLGDHFSQLQVDIEQLGIKAKYFDDEAIGYKHLNGFSHNFRLITDGEKPNYKPEEFYSYLRSSLIQKAVELDPRFEIIAIRSLC